MKLIFPGKSPVRFQLKDDGRIITFLSGIVNGKIAIKPKYGTALFRSFASYYPVCLKGLRKVI